jgi:glycosyltransferase A (GT-A) superfamily protein (DUF2064 family)
LSQEPLDIVLLTKAPIEGRVKTRLGEVLGHGFAVDLHRAMAEDVEALCLEAGVRFSWHVDGPLDHPWVGARSASIRPQAQGDLGTRIAHALGHAGLALGTDSPTLPPAWIANAACSAGDVVLGPTADGGCWCIGWRRPLQGWLDGLAWSTPQVFATLRDRAEKAGASIDVREAWYDVDDPSDLDHLRAHLDTLPATRAPKTRHLLETTRPHAPD